MGSDMYMNPPQPVIESVTKRRPVDAEAALELAFGAMTHGWKVTISPERINQDENGKWTVSVFKGEYI